MNCNYKVNIKDLQDKYTFKIFCSGGDTSTIEQEIGDLSQLTTTAKNNLVSAINEVKGDIPSLSDYVKNTDYATSSTGGVIKSGYYGLQVDSTNGKAYCDTYTYANYGNVENQRFISKGTLENVITGKDLTTKTYVDGLVGNINEALDLINGEEI